MGSVTAPVLTRAQLGRLRIATAEPYDRTVAGKPYVLVAVEDLRAVLAWIERAAPAVDAKAEQGVP